MKNDSYLPFALVSHPYDSVFYHELSESFSGYYALIFML